MKNQLALKVFPPLVLQELQRRAELSLLHYAYFRPHQGLEGRTPAELFFGYESKPLTSTPPPRAGPGQDTAECPFRIEFLDPDERLPILRKAA